MVRELNYCGHPLSCPSHNTALLKVASVLFSQPRLPVCEQAASRCCCGEARHFQQHCTIGCILRNVPSTLICCLSYKHGVLCTLRASKWGWKGIHDATTANGL